MNTKYVGEISEAKVIARLLEKGFKIALPFGDNQRYDLILVEGTKAIRVQCKTGHYFRGGIAFNTCTHNPFTGIKKSYIGEVDLFMVYYPNTGKIYKVPVADCPKVEMRLRLDLPKSRQVKRIKFASDYEF